MEVWVSDWVCEANGLGWMVDGEKRPLSNEDDPPISRSISKGKFGFSFEPELISGGGVGKRPEYCRCTSRARSTREPMNSLVYPLIVVITAGGTDCDRV